MNLTQKQKAFCDLYLSSGNATQSYIKAGYSVSKPQHAEVEGCKLLRNHKVRAYIDERNKALDSSRIATIEEIKEFWTNTMQSKNAKDTDKIRASELLAKTYGAFLDRVEHSGEMTQNINSKPDLSKLSKEELIALDKLLSKSNTESE